MVNRKPDPKKIRPIDLGEHSPDHAGVQILVWVNPPAELVRDVIQVFEVTPQLAKRIAGRDAADVESARIELTVNMTKLIALMARLWSQGADWSTHLAMEDIAAMVREEPAVWRFAMHRTIEMLAQHARPAGKRGRLN